MSRGKEWRGNWALPGQHCTLGSERRSRRRALKDERYGLAPDLNRCGDNWKGQGQKPGGRSGGSLQESGAEMTRARTEVVRDWTDC